MKALALSDLLISSSILYTVHLKYNYWFTFTCLSQLFFSVVSSALVLVFLVKPVELWSWSSGIVFVLVRSALVDGCVVLPVGLLQSLNPLFPTGKTPQVPVRYRDKVYLTSTALRLMISSSLALILPHHPPAPVYCSLHPLFCKAFVLMLPPCDWSNTFLYAFVDLEGHF